jgi:hypothetical protein
MSTWEDADDAAQGNQYFEIGVVLPINLFDGIAESGQGDAVTGIGLVAAPTIINNNCRISFNMPRRGTARLRLFDIAGRLVDNVFSGSLETGAQTIDLETSDLANGVYIVSLETPAGKDVAKIVINR